MIYRNGSVKFGWFLHCGFRNPLAAIWAVSQWFVTFCMKILIFSMKILIFSMKISDFFYENLRFFLRKIIMIFSMIFLTIHKISYSKLESFYGECRNSLAGNNAGRLGSGFISVCLETRWLGKKSGFYVPERPCNPQLSIYIDKYTLYTHMVYMYTALWSIWILPALQVSVLHLGSHQVPK